jgi:hypothetical protein
MKMSWINDPKAVENRMMEVIPPKVSADPAYQCSSLLPGVSTRLSPRADARPVR